MEGKHPLKSKTLWFNAAAAVLAALTQLIPELQSTLDPRDYAIFVAVVSAGNAILRILTTKPLSTKS